MPGRLRTLATVLLLALPVGAVALAGAPTSVFEAEKFPVHTVGARGVSANASGGAFWNLWSNGYAETTVNFPSNASAVASVRLRGSPLGGVQAHYRVLIDGALVKEGDATSTYSWWNSSIVAFRAGNHTIRVQFTNDALSATEDRNLFVDALRFIDATPPPAPAPTPPPAPSGARKEVESFATRTTGGRQGDSGASGGAVWNLWSNGYVQDTLTADGTTPLTIVARGTPLGGVWPRMALAVDGAAAGTFTVGSRTFTSYQGPVLGAGAHAIRISFTNDASNTVEDRNLILDVAVAGASGGTTPPPSLTPSPTLTPSPSPTPPPPSPPPTSRFTVEPGTPRGVSMFWVGGDGFLLLHAATPPTPFVNQRLAVAVDGTALGTYAVMGPVPRPLLLPISLGAGNHSITLTALGGPVIAEALEFRTTPLPLTVSGLAARIHVGGAAAGSAWRFDDFGFLEAPLVVPASGWYELRIAGAGGAPDHGPLVHLMLNRTVVAEGEQGTSVDLRARRFLVADVGYSFGASFENPAAGRWLRVDAISATPSTAPAALPPVMVLPALPAVSGWPQYGRDAWNTRNNPDPALPGPSTAASLALKWRTTVDGSVTGTPAVVGGVVYVGTWNHSLYALREGDGSVLWRTTVADRIDGSVAVGGGLAVVAVGGTVAAFNATTGAPVWSQPFSGHFWASPVIEGGDVFIGLASDRGFLIRIDLATGALRWSVPTTDVAGAGARIWATPLVVPGSGLVVVGTSPGKPIAEVNVSDALMAFDRRTGALVWSHQFFAGDQNRESNATVTINENRDFGMTPQLAYVGGRPVVLCEQKHGPLWTVDLATGAVVSGARPLTPRDVFLGSSAVVGDLVIGSLTEPDHVNAYDLATGDLRWESNLPSTNFAPIATGAGLAWVGTFEGHLHAFDLATGREVAQLSAGGGILGGASLADGRVFVGAIDKAPGATFSNSLGKGPGYVSSWG